jgi:hypothetical protein
MAVTGLALARLFTNFQLTDKDKLGQPNEKKVLFRRTSCIDDLAVAAATA